MWPYHSARSEVAAGLGRNSQRITSLPRRAKKSAERGVMRRGLAIGAMQRLSIFMGHAAPMESASGRAEGSAAIMLRIICAASVARVGFIRSAAHGIYGA